MLCSLNKAVLGEGRLIQGRTGKRGLGSAVVAVTPQTFWTKSLSLSGGVDERQRVEETRWVLGLCFLSLPQ